MKICQIFQSTKITFKTLPKAVEILPKWQNFGRSGHTGCGTVVRPIASQHKRSAVSILPLGHRHSLSNIFEMTRKDKSLPKKSIMADPTSVTRKKSPNVCKSCPKMISEEK